MLEGVSKRSYIGSSSGTYNVRRNELAKQVSGSSVPHTVHFLDGTQHVFMAEKKSKGQMLLDQVFQHLDLLEKDYFGLQFSALENGVKVMRWLDPRKSLRRQCPGVRASQQPVEFHLAVKFYATDVSKLQEEYTRYLLCQQLRSDVQHGHLPLQPTAACVLASYAAQADLGDYCLDEHAHGYLSRVRWMPQLSDELQAKVTELHASHRGLTPSDAEYAYIEHAQRLEMYGVERHPARDCGGRDIQLGVSSGGLLVFHNSIKINTFSWAKIVKIVFKRKEFFIQLRREAPEEYDSLLGFRLGSHRASKCLWRSAVEHHTFFRLLAPQPPVRRRLLGGLMGSGSRFRFSGRTELQALQDGRRAVAAAAGDGRLHRSFARLNGTCGDSSALLRDASHRSLPACDGATRPSASPAAAGGGQLQPVTNTTSSVGLQRRVMATDNSQPTPRLAWTEHDKDGDSGFLERVPAASTVVVGPGALLRAPSSDKQRPLSASSSDVQAAPPAASCYPEPRRYGLLMLDSSSPVSTASSGSPFAPSDLSAAPFMDDSEGSDRSLPERPDQLGPRSPDSPEPSVASHGLSEVGSAASTTSSASLVLVLLRPDQQGRYGFNVKGGADYNSPVTVSKVAPAGGGRLSPRLSEGDQLVLINGVDISSYSHDAVVDLIKSSRDQHSELILTIRPNVNYEGGDDVEEPLVQYVPDRTPRTSMTAGDADSPLAQSLLLLSEALASGAARREFDKLQRRAPELTMDDSLIQNNILKNRYRDISPYDSTRVLLLQAHSGDYINANHVTMEIPGSGGIVNRYIAAQGPLKQTVDDFWTMVWEQRSSLVVMLTTLIEQSRVKCHLYWPAYGESSCHQLAKGQQLRVSCYDEELGDSFRYRNLRLLCVETGEERHVMHVQYMSWPDHGVPADCGDFVQFVERVREARRLRAPCEPVVVHCSAGIGRTGVLILMETALCLMDAAQPVYPLHLVLTMRQQRAMMVQTAVQYEFVCEAIQRVYETGHGVTPIPSPAPAGGRQSPEASSEVQCPPAAEDDLQQSPVVVAESAGGYVDGFSVDSAAGDDEEVKWRGVKSGRSPSPEDCVSLSSESPANGGNAAPVPVFAYSV